MDRAVVRSAVGAALILGAVLGAGSTLAARSEAGVAQLNARDTLVVGIECGDDFVVTLTDPLGRTATWRLGPIESHIPGCRVQLPYEGAEEEADKDLPRTESKDASAPEDSILNQLGNAVFWIQAPAVGRWRVAATAGRGMKNNVGLSVRLASRGVWLPHIGGRRPWAILGARQVAMGSIDVRRSGEVVVSPALVRDGKATSTRHER